MEAASVQKYDYLFTVWPEITHTLHDAMFDLFQVLQARAEMTFTETEFAEFRRGLAMHSLTLREITRVPHFEPETVL